MYVQRTKKNKNAFHVRKRWRFSEHLQCTCFLMGKNNECVNTWNKPVNKSSEHQQCMRTQCNFPPIIANVRPWVTWFHRTPHNYEDENILTNNPESARHLHILLFLFVSKKKKVSRVSFMVCNRNNFLITHYMASTTIQNCILKNTISCTHVCTTQNSTGHMAGVVVLLFSFVFYSTLHKNGTLFFNVKLSAACNIAMHAYKGGGGEEKREISLGMPIRQATAVPSLDGWLFWSKQPHPTLLRAWNRHVPSLRYWWKSMPALYKHASQCSYNTRTKEKN